jgi:hypothetical protein
MATCRPFTGQTGVRALAETRGEAVTRDELFLLVPELADLIALAEGDEPLPEDDTEEVTL